LSIIITFDLLDKPTKDIPLSVNIFFISFVVCFNNLKYFKQSKSSKKSSSKYSKKSTSSEADNCPSGK